MNELKAIERLIQRIQKPAPSVLKTGDKAGRFTFLGIDADGRLLCRCDCGTVEVATARLLGSILKAPSQHRCNLACPDALLYMPGNGRKNEGCALRLNGEHPATVSRMPRESRAARLALWQCQMIRRTAT